MDIRQMVAMLLIPHLAKISQGIYVDSITNEEGEKTSASRPGISVAPKSGDCAPISVNDRTIEVLTNEIVADVQKDSLIGEDREPVVTKDFLRHIFEAHDEVMVADEVLEEMIEAVGQGSTFNAKTFLQGLTKDLAAWDVEWETKFSSAYADVMGLDFLNKAEDDDGEGIGKSNSQTFSSTRGSNNFASTHSDTEAPKTNDSFLQKARRVFTLSEIDNTADTYGSESFVVFLWAAFITVYIAYVYSTGSGGINVTCKNISGFGCQIGNAVVNWFGIMAQLIVLGGLFFIVGSFGNSIFLTRGILSITKVILSMSIIFISTIYFFFDSGINTWFINTSWEDQNFLFSLFNYCALGFGGVLLLLQLHTLARLFIPAGYLQRSKVMGRLLLPGAVPKEVRTKRAAAFKTNRMIENAMSFHLTGLELSNHKSLRTSGFMSANGHAMTGFLRKSHEREKTGGLLWGWKEFLSGRICFEEGVFFHSRLIASCIAQLLLIFLIVAIVVFAFILIDEIYRTAEDSDLDAEYHWGDCSGTECDLVVVAGNSTESALNETLQSDENITLEQYGDYFDFMIRKEINSTLTNLLSGAGVEIDEAFLNDFYVSLQASLYNLTGVDLVSLYSLYVTSSSYDTTESNYDWITDNVKKSDCYVAIGVGFFVSFFSIVIATFNYIPSFIMNVMKFRYGVIGSLEDVEFQRYKEGPDHPTLVFGIVFWSQLFTASISFVVAGLIAFFIVWSMSSSFVLFIAAQLIGISVTLIPKIVGILAFRGYAFAGYYRKKVAFANVIFVLLECWNIAITVGFLMVRTVTLFLLAIFYIGRIDTPFLAEEVDKFDFMSDAAYLDRAPVYYRKDLLLHEAHRHPYIERLGALCLLKLNQGRAFGTRGGSAWRLLFVLTLMPWLKKYRVAARKVDYFKLRMDPIKPSGLNERSAQNFSSALNDSEEETVMAEVVDTASDKEKKKLKKAKRAKKSFKKGPPLSAYESSDFVSH
ncbi:hypothetical protein IV203_017241 [Nitzschia inconspicua]|uniref:Uncharacterized protein n=1 Tax=Nitzschia inconspicua TaxID=303405 RepID=A0A9K3PJ15_9STRA|nr:hypothetical protein IV203_017241 [Nitzschia inconspicua]